MTMSRVGDFFAGVPLITPVCSSSVRPLGKEPLVTEYDVGVNFVADIATGVMGTPA
jgi:hypothetical protein